jgi:hypothetical protein
VSYRPVDAAERAALLDGSLPAVAPLRGSVVLVEDVANVTVRNLTFRDADYFAIGTWTGPAAQPSDGAVRVNAATGVAVDACRFAAGLSGYGVVVGNASKDVTVAASTFADLGQGGVLFYGVDDATTALNRPPSRGDVRWCVFERLGRTLIHAAAVGLRSASETYVGHNRISDVPRYALQADTFYNLSVAGGRWSRSNVFEHNVVDLASTETTDTGAIELLGSQDPAPVGFDLHNVIRYNKVSRVLGSSSTDGRDVCRGSAADAARGCRGLAWSIYLDGNYAGATIYGNVLDGSSKGALVVNGGGNVSFYNNVVLAPKTAAVELSACYAGDAARVAWPGTTLRANVFYLPDAGSSAIALPGPPNTRECTMIPGRVDSDRNLFWSPVADVAARALFPANGTLAAWRRGNASAPGGRDDAPPFRWAGGDRRSRVADPLFADVANGVLEPASPAFALGFAALPDFERLVPPKDTRDAPW